MNKTSFQEAQTCSYKYSQTCKYSKAKRCRVSKQAVLVGGLQASGVPSSAGSGVCWWMAFTRQTALKLGTPSFNDVCSCSSQPWEEASIRLRACRGRSPASSGGGVRREQRAAGGVSDLPVQLSPLGPRRDGIFDVVPAAAFTSGLVCVGGGPRETGSQAGVTGRSRARRL